MDDERAEIGPEVVTSAPDGERWRVDSPARPADAQSPAPAQPPALPEVNRAVMPRSAPRPAAPRAWFGWAAVIVLTLLGGMFYVLRYTPLQRDLERGERTRLQESQQHAAAMQRLTTQLEDTTHMLEDLQLKAAVAAESEAVHATELMRPTEPTTEQRARETQNSGAARRTAKRERNAAGSTAREVEHRSRTPRGVDLEAESAATAALEAEAYGSKSRSGDGSGGDSKPTQPNSRASKDTLSGVLDESDDPLHGL